MPLVELTVQDDIARVTLNRPDKRNALSPDLLGALVDTLRTAERQGPRALLLAGHGPVFCAGGDIEAMQQRLGKPNATEASLRALLNPAIRAVHAFPAPTVARVQGAALGAGLGLALSCDLTVAAEDAKLGAVHTRLGLTPDGGTSWFLPQLVGPKRAIELVVRAETITGQRAEALGLVTSAVPEGELASTCDGLVEELARGPTRAYRMARELVQAGTQGTLEQALEREARAQGMAYATEDQQEGVRAFLEKREAAFEGR